MNSLTTQDISLPVCGWHFESPWPSFKSWVKVKGPLEFDHELPAEECQYYGKGFPMDILPYSEQDGYTRQRNVRSMKSFVLENNALRAVFMPQVGGRLWSLFDKKRNREVLYKNSVLQFASLAIRNAWLSGGIEWNCGFSGHAPTTSTDIFAASVTGKNGKPVLRIYEWERVKQVIFQIDFFFQDDDSDFLMVAVRIMNPNSFDTETYWWANAAFPQTSQTRVIVPSTKGIVSSKGMKLVDHLNFKGVDASYPDRVQNAIDFFYYLPNGIRPWEVAVDGDGYGVLCTSTRTLRGRKLFLWGQGKGSHHWSDFLSAENNRPYIEIQSGLGKTQLEHIPLEANGEFFWVEAFGAVKLDPECAHNVQYEVAQMAAAEQVDARLCDKKLDEIAQEAYCVMQKAPDKLLHTGSGWGALENRRRMMDGETAFPVCVPFLENSMGKLQQPWLEALEGKQPDPETLSLPSWQCAESWMAHVALAPNGAWKNYQLALNLIRKKEYACALSVIQSDSLRENAPFLYLMAYSQEQLKQNDKALNTWKLLISKTKGDVQLLSKALKFFLNMKKERDLYDMLPDDGCDPTNRIKEIRLRLLLELDRLEEAEAMLAVPFEISNQAEGEISLSELWMMLQTRKLAQNNSEEWTPDFHQKNKAIFVDRVPVWLDFRMESEEV